MKHSSFVVVVVVVAAAANFTHVYCLIAQKKGLSFQRGYS